MVLADSDTQGKILYRIFQGTFSLCQRIHIFLNFFISLNVYWGLIFINLAIICMLTWATSFFKCLGQYVFLPCFYFSHYIYDLSFSALLTSTNFWSGWSTSDPLILLILFLLHWIMTSKEQRLFLFIMCMIWASIIVFHILLII